MNTESGAATPPSRLKTQRNYRAENALVVEFAAGRWPEILMAHGIPEQHLCGKHSSCPIHGGKDGFRFTDEGKGYWVCATCTEGKFKDGFTLIALKNGITNAEAFKRVAQYLNLNAVSPLQENSEKQLIYPKQYHNQQATKLEEEQRSFVKKKVAGTHAVNILNNCVWKSHPYLQNKSVNQSVLVNKTNYEIHYKKTNPRTGKIENNKQTVYAGALIIPIYDINDHQQPIGAQFINANGRRAYITDTSIAEGIHIIKGNDNLPYVGAVEGYATGLSVYMATGATIIVAFDANGIKSKAERLKASFSGKQLVFYGDNDSNKKNTGNKAALEAATKTNGIMIIPPEAGQDWNDYHQTHGLDATRIEIDKQLESQRIKGVCMIENHKDNVSENQFPKEKSGNNILPLTARIKTEDYPDLIDTKYGVKKPLNTYGNLKHMLDRLGIIVRWNDMARIREVTIPSAHVFYDDEENSALREITNLAEINHLPTTKINDHLDSLAQQDHYHPIVECIKLIPWDHVERLDKFTQTVKIKNESDISHKIIRRWMISAIAAAFSDKGFSSQGVLVLQGKQNLGKTRWVKALDPINCGAVREGALLDPSNKDTVRTCASHWIVELGELDGTFRKSDIARLKSHITNQVDIIRFPHARKDSRLPRRTAFVATVNESRYLIDDTGNRRWWTIAVERIDINHDLDMQQVWAEVYHRWINGEQTWLTEEELNLITQSNIEHEQVDPFEEKVLDYFDWSDNWQKYNTVSMSSSEVLKAVGYDNPNKAQATHMGNILTKITGKTPCRRKHTLPGVKHSRSY